MSLEENKSNVELKELYANVLEAGEEYNNLETILSETAKIYKSKLQNTIELLKANSQYESQSTEEEKLKINSWYEDATDASQ